MLVAEKFIRFLAPEYGKHIVYTDAGTWYDEEFNVIGLKQYLYSSIEKSLMERVNHYLKDRKVLMITIRVDKRNVIYFTYLTDYNALYLYITIL